MIIIMTMKNISKTKLIALNATIFVLAFALFSTPTEADAACVPGSYGKWTATGKSTESGDRYGSEGIVNVSNFTICGTVNSGSYAHAAVVLTTNTGTNFVEGMTYQGYPESGTSSTDPSTIVIHSNSIDSPYAQIIDVSGSTGNEPDIGDDVKITVYHDYNSGFPLYRDYDKVIINNADQSYTDTVSNIWTNGKGKLPYAQTEVLSVNQEVKAQIDTLKDQSTSGTWTSFSSAQAEQTLYGGTYQLCAVENANNDFNFLV